QRFVHANFNNRKENTKNAKANNFFEFFAVKIPTLQQTQDENRLQSKCRRLLFVCRPGFQCALPSPCRRSRRLSAFVWRAVPFPAGRSRQNFSPRSPSCRRDARFGAGCPRGRDLLSGWSADSRFCEREFPLARA